MAWAKSPGIIELHTGAQARFVPAANASSHKLPVVIVVHGWRSVGNHRYPAVFTEQGYHALYLTLRGHAAAAGDILKVTRQDHLDDALAAVEYLGTRSDVDMSRLCGFGTSYGAYVVAVLAGQVPMKLIAMRVPANYPDKGWNQPIAPSIDDDHALDEWRSKRHGADENRALADLAKGDAKLLVVESEDDEYLPPMEAQNYVRAPKTSAGILVTMKGARHQLDTEQVAEFTATLKAFFFSGYPSPSTS